MRLFLAFLVGAIVGTERKFRHKPAGLRTHALVGLGAALFTIISVYGFLEFSGPPYYRANMDPARIAAQIVVGVGFIGGGLIFREKNQLSGLTTAASIWLTAGLGTGIGAGMYFTVFIAGILGFIALRLNRIFKSIGLDSLAEDHYSPHDDH
ncbi:MgtC/SapB family protein [Pelotomaculum propionicicum]|uniref:MgtC/SapB family protein n=1 Tax=Pelotomaculum propionicicum TaxID=258475 RepID=UPI003B9EB0E5